jgi:hypothetical protein
MSYAILRIEKAKTMANVGSRAAHNMRQNPTAAPHADPAKRVLNRVLIGPSDAAGVVAAVEKRLANVPKFRKDAVRAVELLMTASPEFFDPAKPDQKKWTAWVKDSLAWLRQTWGAENVVSAVLHRDEATPHIQAFVVPIHDGKLRAAHWLDGPAKLSQLQDSFAVAMWSQGLRRGEKHSQANHTSLREFYQLANRIQKAVQAVKNKPPSLPPRGMLGRVSPEDWGHLEADLKRYGTEGLKLRSEAVAAQLMASSAIGDEQRQRAEEAERRRRVAELALVELQKKLKDGEELVSGIRDQYNKLHAMNKDLDVAIDEKREILKIGKLELYRDELISEIQKMQPDQDIDMLH